MALVLVLGIRAGWSVLPARGAVTARQWRLLVITGVVNMVTNAAVFAAYNTTAVAIVVIILYSYPALVTLGANRLWGESIDRVRAAALGLASLGLLLVVVAPMLGDSGVRLDVLGLLLAAAAAIGQALYTLLAARGFPAVPSVLSATAIMGVVVVCNVAFTILVGAGAQLRAPVADPSLWWWVLLAGLVGAALPGIALLMGIRSVGPSRAAILMMLEPVTAVLLAGLFLGEEPSAVQVLGGGMVVVAGAILQLPSRRPDAPLRGTASS